MYCLLQPALAETAKADDVRSLQAALDRARVKKRITRIELATGTYALHSSPPRSTPVGNIRRINISSTGRSGVSAVGL
jgi:hypothetical protein